jgi:hypothetical protein
VHRSAALGSSVLRRLPDKIHNIPKVKICGPSHVTKKCRKTEIAFRPTEFVKKLARNWYKTKCVGRQLSAHLFYIGCQKKITIYQKRVYLSICASFGIFSSFLNKKSGSLNLFRVKKIKLPEKSRKVQKWHFVKFCEPTYVTKKIQEN